MLLVGGAMIGRNIVLGEWECFNPKDAIV
jgi:hypothetical protein